MKTILTVFALATVLTLASCGSGTSTEVTTSTDSTSVVVDTTAVVIDSTAVDSTSVK
jgi:hypothetical protein